MQATQIDRNEEIRQLAYKIWQESGCPDGADVQHWLKAQEIWLETHAPKKRRAIPSKARKPSKNVATKREL
jgi:hypothetical protein